MKSLNIIKHLLAVALIAAGFAGMDAAAQSPGGPPTGMNTVIVRLLRNSAFTANAEIRIKDKSGKETTYMPMTYAMLDGKSRFELDMMKVKSTDLPAGAPAFMKQLGMDHLIVITRPDRKLTLVIYPAMPGYTESTMSADEQAPFIKDYKLTKTRLGKETIDGHACEKNKVVLTDEKGQELTATVWNATDLKEFPLQIEMADQDNTIAMKFKDVKFVRLDAKQFEAPANLTKYDDAQMRKKYSSAGQK